MREYPLSWATFFALSYVAIARAMQTQVVLPVCAVEYSVSQFFAAPILKSEQEIQETLDRRATYTESDIESLCLSIAVNGNPSQMAVFAAYHQTAIKFDDKSDCLTQIDSSTLPVQPTFRQYLTLSHFELVYSYAFNCNMSQAMKNRDLTQLNNYIEAGADVFYANGESSSHLPVVWQQLSEKLLRDHSPKLKRLSLLKEIDETIDAKQFEEFSSLKKRVQTIVKGERQAKDKSALLVRLARLQFFTGDTMSLFQLATSEVKGGFNTHIYTAVIARVMFDNQLENSTDEEGHEPCGLVNVDWVKRFISMRRAYINEPGPVEISSRPYAAITRNYISYTDKYPFEFLYGFPTRDTEHHMTTLQLSSNKVISHKIKDNIIKLYVILAQDTLLSYIFPLYVKWQADALIRENIRDFGSAYRHMAGVIESLYLDKFSSDRSLVSYLLNFDNSHQTRMDKVAFYYDKKQPVVRFSDEPTDTEINMAFTALSQYLQPKGEEKYFTRGSYKMMYHLIDPLKRASKPIPLNNVYAINLLNLLLQKSCLQNNECDEMGGFIKLLIEKCYPDYLLTSYQEIFQHYYNIAYVPSIQPYDLGSVVQRARERFKNANHVNFESFRHRADLIELIATALKIFTPISIMTLHCLEAHIRKRQVLKSVSKLVEKNNKTESLKLLKTFIQNWVKTNLNEKIKLQLLWSTERYDVQNSEKNLQLNWQNYEVGADNNKTMCIQLFVAENDFLKDQPISVLRTISEKKIALEKSHKIELLKMLVSEIGGSIDDDRIIFDLEQLDMALLEQRILANKKSDINEKLEKKIREFLRIDEIIQACEQSSKAESLKRRREALVHSLSEYLATLEVAEKSACEYENEYKNKDASGLTAKRLDAVRSKVVFHKELISTCCNKIKEIQQNLQENDKDNIEKLSTQIRFEVARATNFKFVEDAIDAYHLAENHQGNKEGHSSTKKTSKVTRDKKQTHTESIQSQFLNCSKDIKTKLAEHSKEVSSLDEKLQKMLNDCYMGSNPDIKAQYDNLVKSIKACQQANRDRVNSLRVRYDTLENSKESDVAILLAEAQSLQEELNACDFSFSELEQVYQQYIEARDNHTQQERQQNKKHKTMQNFFFEQPLPSSGSMAINSDDFTPNESEKLNKLFVIARSIQEVQGNPHLTNDLLENQRRRCVALRITQIFEILSQPVLAYKVQTYLNMNVNCFMKARNAAIYSAHFYLYSGNSDSQVLFDFKDLVCRLFIGKINIYRYKLKEREDLNKIRLEKTQFIRGFHAHNENFKQQAQQLLTAELDFIRATLKTLSNTCRHIQDRICQASLLASVVAVGRLYREVALGEVSFNQTLFERFVDPNENNPKGVIEKRSRQECMGILTQVANALVHEADFNVDLLGDRALIDLLQVCAWHLSHHTVTPSASTTLLGVSIDNEVCASTSTVFKGMP